MKLISIIVAMSENRVIGMKNQLPWRLSEDLKRFKRLTTDHTVLMGRKTFESLPNGALPNRENLVLTGNKNSHLPNCQVVYSIDEALLYLSSDHENFIIGGGKIYEQFLPLAQRIYLTKVHTQVEGDTYFPEIDEHTWEALEHDFVPASEKNDYPSTFMLLERIKSV